MKKLKCLNIFLIINLLLNILIPIISYADTQDSYISAKVYDSQQYHVYCC